MQVVEFLDYQSETLVTTICYRLANITYLKHKMEFHLQHAIDSTLPCFNSTA